MPAGRGESVLFIILDLIQSFFDLKNQFNSLLINPLINHLKMAKGKKNGKKVTTNVVQPPKQPFDWCNFLLDDNKFKAAPVSLFPNLNITSNWPNLINTSLKVEVFNPTAVLPSDIRVIHDCFWIAGVIQIEGFFVCLRWEGKFCCFF